ncbi:response regulator transcription factor [Geomonas sp. RF6]|uniref:response regulator n=1 Tax=Geomonas sp. RF6 TaxID=2897342 RepID=UPI001E564D51|nr:response regulator transcription factor [Geomonas sp. RF6]UFS72535.1 response regulator transcription factor [Geomonas sp. RF6]
MAIKVLLVDDHRLVREGVRRILEGEPSIEVVGEADTGRLAVSMAKELGSGVVLMDLSMPDMNGIDAIRQISADAPDVRCVVLSMHSTPRFVTEAIGAGAKGYLLKDSAGKELMEAIRAVARDTVYLSPAIAGVIVHDYHRRFSSAAPVEEPVISARERQVLQAYAEGKNTKEIAYHLGLSIKTIESHRAQIMKKLGLRTVADMVRYAIREGIISL